MAPAVDKRFVQAFQGVPPGEAQNWVRSVPAIMEI